MASKDRETAALAYMRLSESPSDWNLRESIMLEDNYRAGSGHRAGPRPDFWTVEKGFDAFVAQVKRGWSGKELTFPNGVPTLTTVK